MEVAEISRVPVDLEGKQALKECGLPPKAKNHLVFHFAALNSKKGKKQ